MILCDVHCAYQYEQQMDENSDRKNLTDVKFHLQN